MRIPIFLFRPTLILGIAAILIAGGGTGCTTVVGMVHQGERLVTQGKYDHSIDDNDRNELGKSVGLLVTNLYPPVEDPKLVEYVNLVGFTLVAESDKPDGQYIFSVLDTRDIGAYTGPDGYVFITLGAIKSMHSEAELAGLLAHELAHGNHHHAVDSATGAAEKNGFMDEKTQGIMASDGSRYIDAGIDAAVRNGYEKNQEIDADKGAVRLMIAAGYDPHAYADYLSRLAAIEKTAEGKKLTTHFDYAQQAGFVTQEIAAAGPGRGATLEERFATYVGK